MAAPLSCESNIYQLVRAPLGQQSTATSLILHLHCTCQQCPQHAALQPVDAGSPQQQAASSAYGVASPQAMQLYEEIMRYRASLRLPRIPMCQHLNQVAAWHVYDLQTIHPTERFRLYPACNTHTWSSSSRWTGCCFPDNATPAQAKCMWDKPRELSAYRGNGYEIAYWSGGTAAPSAAVQWWKGSPGHNSVMVNGGGFKDSWGAVGVAIGQNYAVAWFGKEPCPG